MIVPKYWSEARVQALRNGKQITVRRFGWSDSSQSEAQQLADQRAADALHRIVNGEKLPRREPKRAYNGAQGVPIREEIVGVFGDTVITRNSYGALCLNSPNVLFGDIDFPVNSLDSSTALVIAAIFSIPIGIIAGSVIGTFLSVLLCYFAAYISLFVILIVVNTLRKWLTGDQVKFYELKVERFVEAHHGWSVTVYRTPAGMRVLATHQTFDPLALEVEQFFTALKVDPIFRKMCKNQRCFRARVSPKPWRIGIHDHLKPRPGIWPIAPENMPARRAWIERYDQRSLSFAACHLLRTIGPNHVHEDVLAVKNLHDDLCRAISQLPIA